LRPAAWRSCAADQEREEYSVWSVTIRDTVAGTPAVVANSMEPGQLLRFPMIGRPTVRSLRKNLPDLLPDAADSFLARNQSGTFTFADRFDAAANVVLVDRKELVELFEHWTGPRTSDGWELFRARFSDTAVVVRLSRVGFSADCSQALVYVGAGCGWRCGHGVLILLARHGETWTVSNGRELWIAAAPADSLPARGAEAPPPAARPAARRARARRGGAGPRVPSSGEAARAARRSRDAQLHGAERSGAKWS